MTEHKKLTRVYGANLCTFCGRAWEDGEEIPDCVAPQEETQKTRKKFFRAYFPEPTQFTAWLLYGNNGKAMVAYADHREVALRIGYYWTRNRKDIVKVEESAELTRFAVWQSVPYIEINPVIINKLNQLSKKGDNIIISPANFKKAIYD